MGGSCLALGPGHPAAGFRVTDRSAPLLFHLVDGIGFVGRDPAIGILEAGRDDAKQGLLDVVADGIHAFLVDVTAEDALMGEGHGELVDLARQGLVDVKHINEVIDGMERQTPTGQVDVLRAHQTPNMAVRRTAWG